MRIGMVKLASPGCVTARVRRAAICLAVVLLPASCGSPTDNTPHDFAGRWIVNESGGVRELDVSCVSSGVLQLSQAGSDVSGDYDMRGQCTLGNQATDSPRFGPITAARVDGTKLTFNHGRCTYTGYSLRASADSATGKLKCTYPIEGRDYNYVGTWSAVRVPPVTVVIAASRTILAPPTQQ